MTKFFTKHDEETSSGLCHLKYDSRQRPWVMADSQSPISIRGQKVETKQVRRCSDTLRCTTTGEKQFLFYHQPPFTRMLGDSLHAWIAVDAAGNVLAQAPTEPALLSKLE